MSDIVERLQETAAEAQAADLFVIAARAVEAVDEIKRLRNIPSFNAEEVEKAWAAVREAEAKLAKVRKALDEVAPITTIRRILDEAALKHIELRHAATCKAWLGPYIVEKDCTCGVSEDA